MRLRITGVPPRFIARRYARFVLALAMAVAAMGALCEPTAKPIEITRDRAIEIVRPEIHFKPDSVEAVRATSMGREVWRVTVKGRLPDQPPGLFETRIFELDVRTGEIVSASMN